MGLEFDGTNIPKTEELKTQEVSATGGSDSPEIEDFLNDEKLKNNKEKIKNVLNKEGNKALKVGLKNFILTEKNVIKVNGYKLKLSKAADEKEIEDVIRRLIPGGYKIGDKKVEEKAKENAGKEDTNLEDNLLQAQEKEKQAKEDDKKAKEDDKKAEEDNKVEKEKKEKEEAEKKLIEAIGYRQELASTHGDLEAKTGPGSEQYENVKDQLEQKGILKQLEYKNYDKDFINKFIIVQATLLEIKNNPSYSEEEISTFDKIVKNLNNACRIPDTNLSSFEDRNISQTRTELFNKDIGNESLIKAKEDNMKSESHEKVYNEMFPQMGDTEMFKKYGRFLQGESKVFWLQYETNSDIRNKVRNAQENPTEENRGLLESYNKMYAETLKIKDDYDTKTKDMVEELCIVSQIKGMYRCMGKGDNFDLNKAKEIDSENGVLTLRGHIDGIDFAIRHDTTKLSPLQTSSKLAKEKQSADDTDKSNNFIIGGRDKFVNSNFKLPTQDEIFSSITNTIMSDSSLENAANQEEYFEDLQRNIMGNIDEKYNETELVHDYMREQVKGEKVIDKTIGLMKNIRGVDPESTVSNSNPKLYNFLNLINHNVKYSTEQEKDRMNVIMDKINRMATLSKSNPSSSEIVSHEDKFGKYLTGNSFENTKNILNDKPVEGETAFDLFKKYKLESDSRNNGELYMLNFEQLYNDLLTAENNQKKEDETRNDPIIAAIEENNGAGLDDLLNNPTPHPTSDSTSGMA